MTRTSTRRRLVRPRPAPAAASRSAMMPTKALGAISARVGGSAEIERVPAAYGDLRGWIAALEAAGELRVIGAEVDWNVELGTIMRLTQGAGTGPALLFNNIKDYNLPRSRCRRLFGGGLSGYRRIAMMLGLPPDTHPRALVKVGRTILDGRIAPTVVKDGPVKEKVITGKDVDLFDLPAPQWNRPDGGRYLLTYGGVVTRDPDSGIMNVGIYRGMIARRDRLSVMMWRAQHIGDHATAWQRSGRSEMPIAIAIGWEPAFGLCAGSRIPKGVCEYDVMGAIRGQPVDLVRCETVDLYVPASAEIVIEGYLGFDPATYEMEGPFAEFTGYLSGERAPRPTIRVTAITHRHDPILRGTIEGSMPGSYSENAVCSSILRAATAWNVLEQAGVPGVTDVWCPPVTAGIHLLIRMKPSYLGQAKQAANAIWGSSAAHVRYKNVTVVDDDVDIHDYAAVDWAIAYRVNAGEDDIVVMPATYGAALDPSTGSSGQSADLFGTATWNRVLIDATRRRQCSRAAEGQGFPPNVWPSPHDLAGVRARWRELGFASPHAVGG